jgi:hypothetical protein
MIRNFYEDFERINQLHEEDKCRVKNAFKAMIIKNEIAEQLTNSVDFESTFCPMSYMTNEYLGDR